MSGQTVNTNDDKKKYGFFSYKAYNLGYGAIWLNPKGDQVTITYVGDTPEIPNSYKWEDTVPVGEVTQFVKSLGESPKKKSNYTCNEYLDTLLYDFKKDTI